MGKITAWYELLIHGDNQDTGSGRNEAKRAPTASFNNSGGKCNTVMDRKQRHGGSQPDTFHFLLGSFSLRLGPREWKRDGEGTREYACTPATLMCTGLCCMCMLCHKCLLSFTVITLWARGKLSHTLNHYERQTEHSVKKWKLKAPSGWWGGVHQLLGIHSICHVFLFWFITFSGNVGVNEQHKWLPHFSAGAIWCLHETDRFD